MDDRDLISPEEHEDELAAENADGDYEPEAPNENWLVSYADLMTLLFGFFAMLYLTQVVAPKVEPRPEQKQEQKQEQAADPAAKPKEEVAEPPPGGAKGPEPPKLLPAEKTGGERGFHFFELFPEELVLAMLVGTFFYVVLFLLGLRRHRVLVDPFTGTRTVRRVPVLQVAASARKPLTEEQLALKAKEDEILRTDDLMVIEDPHAEVAHMADERWLISYADLMTLLFGFFAMLYLMGPNFEAVKASMDETFTRSQKMRISRMKPIDVPQLEAPINTVTAPETRVATSTAGPATSEISTSTGIPTVTIAETQTMVSTSQATVVKPRATPTREELQRAEEEKLLTLKERVKERMREQAEAEQNLRRIKELKEQRASEAETARGRAMDRFLEKNPEKGKGGSGVGGGKGRGAGAGTTSNVGSAICSEGAITPYRDSCWGNGFYGCLNAELLTTTGGQNGTGSAVEFYCVGGRTRVCLTNEHCPWRTAGAAPEDYLNGYRGLQGNSASMTCSPAGLAISSPEERAVIAVCRGHVDCGFTSMECDGNGNLFFR